MTLATRIVGGGLLVAGCSPDALGQGEGSTTFTSVSASGTVGASGMASTVTGPTGSGDLGSLDGTGSSTTSGSGSSTGEPEPALLAHFDTFAAPDRAGIHSVEGVGFEPRAVLLWITGHDQEGAVDAGLLGRGWTDGTHDGAVATAWQPGGNSTRSRWADQACVTLVSPTGDLLAEASVASFDPDGFSLDWSEPGAGRMVAYLALGGDIEARVGNEPLAAAVETIEVGFSPDVVMLAGVQNLAAAGTNQRGGHGFGVAVPGGSSHASAHREQDGGNEGSSGLSEDVAIVIADSSPPPDEAYALSGVDSDGFALSRALGTNAVGSTWLALRGVQARSGVTIQPGLPEDQVIAAGFAPVVVMFDGGDKPMWQDEPEIVHGVAVGTESQAALWVGRNGTANQSIWDLQRAITSHEVGARAQSAEASITAIDAGGFTLSWSAADDVARQVGWVALGSPIR